MAGQILLFENLNVVLSLMIRYYHLKSLVALPIFRLVFHNYFLKCN